MERASKSVGPKSTTQHCPLFFLWRQKNVLIVAPDSSDAAQDLCLGILGILGTDFVCTT